jgi:hypothetical protein
MFTAQNCMSMHDPHLHIQSCNIILNDQGPASSCAAIDANLSMYQPSLGLTLVNVPVETFLELES